jgi:hypothetical protein
MKINQSRNKREGQYMAGIKIGYVYNPNTKWDVTRWKRPNMRSGGHGTIAVHLRGIKTGVMFVWSARDWRIK